MHKKLLLATVLVSSIHIANATCTPPTTLKCNCAHPIINSEGKLACGASYCGDKKCMPNGSCCETEKYCESSELGKQCCADGQTCDTTKGCVEKPVATLTCADASYKHCSLNGAEWCCLKSGNWVYECGEEVYTCVEDCMDIDHPENWYWYIWPDFVQEMSELDGSLWLGDPDLAPVNYYCKCNGKLGTCSLELQ